jgi:hypothetical protein
MRIVELDAEYSDCQDIGKEVMHSHDVHKVTTYLSYPINIIISVSYFIDGSQEVIFYAFHLNNVKLAFPNLCLPFPSQLLSLIPTFCSSPFVTSTLSPETT